MLTTAVLALLAFLFPRARRQVLMAFQGFGQRVRNAIGRGPHV